MRVVRTGTQPPAQCSARPQKVRLRWGARWTPRVRGRASACSRLRSHVGGKERGGKPPRQPGGPPPTGFRGWPGVQGSRPDPGCVNRARGSSEWRGLHSPLGSACWMNPETDLAWARSPFPYPEHYRVSPGLVRLERAFCTVENVSEPDF